ncbi:hypothetical protein ABQJ54_12795 [Rhodanobacter sp. Si-c]|uniref:DUF1440 domain-containing protein n=1 Tax=Rhodanobacter lycopersici TaxID=3162487 RepID=A0ABV3QGG2_9GAMM
MNQTGRAILCGGFIAGTIDIGAAALINHLSPAMILHAIASGVLGNASFQAGAPAAWLGLGLQWAMSLLIAAIFVMAATRMTWLRGRWPLAGLAYGVAIYVVMNYAVVPLSAAPFKAPAAPMPVVLNLLAMLLFGLIVAFFARKPARA